MLAAWSGIRPLVTNPDSKDTQSLSRNHVVTVSDSGLVTIAGTGASFHLQLCWASPGHSLQKSCSVGILLLPWLCQWHGAGLEQAWQQPCDAWNAQVCLEGVKAVLLLLAPHNEVSTVPPGGKWTTYRAMARDTIDAAVREHRLQAGSCRTMGLQLEGAQDWSPTLYIRLVQDYGLESEVSAASCLAGLWSSPLSNTSIAWARSGEPDQSWGRDSSNRKKGSNCSSSPPFVFLHILTISC